MTLWLRRRTDGLCELWGAYPGDGKPRLQGVVEAEEMARRCWPMVIWI